MRTLVLRLVVLLPLLFLVPVAEADTVSAGDFLKFSDRPGSPGGEFGLTVSNTPGGSAVDFFVTFCLQKTEYMNFTSNFIVGSITDHTLTDPTNKGGNAAGEDPISSQTAWLYTQYRKADHGVLGALGYTGNATWANALQNAFWYFEDELTTAEKAALLASGNPFIAAANTAVTNGWSGIGNIRVINIFKYDPKKPGGIGDEAQDQLVKVPEPSSLVLLGMGALSVGFRRRRTATS